MRHLLCTKVLTALLLSLTFIFNSYADIDPNIWNSERTTKELVIKVKDSDRFMRYGEYAEVELFVDSSNLATFQFTGKMTPPGMRIIPLSSQSALMVGWPKFVGKFCFSVSVNLLGVFGQGEKRLCLISEENIDLTHPKFETGRFLRDIPKSTHVDDNILLDKDSYNLYPAMTQSTLPDGMDVYPREGHANLSGSSVKEGNYEFVLLARRYTEESIFSVSKQYQVSITSMEKEAYQCMAGYYYDKLLGHCMQAQGALCDQGSFFNMVQKKCEKFSVSSHSFICQDKEYFDHFRGECVQKSVKMCPLSFEYDLLHNRCMPLVKKCKMGSHFDYNKKECVQNLKSCEQQKYWDGKSCVNNKRGCSKNEYFDPYLKKCNFKSLYPKCLKGFFYNHKEGLCVKVELYKNRLCKKGFRWSFKDKGCISHREVIAPAPRPNRVRVNRRRPMPRPRRN